MNMRKGDLVMQVESDVQISAFERNGWTREYAKPEAEPEIKVEPVAELIEEPVVEQEEPKVEAEKKPEHKRPGRRRKEA